MTDDLPWNTVVAGLPTAMAMALEAAWPGRVVVPLTRQEGALVPAPFLAAVTVSWSHTTTVAWRENEMVRCPAPAPTTVAWPMTKPVAWTVPGGTTVDSEENETVQWLARATADWPRRNGEVWLMKWASYLARLPVPL